MNPDDSTPAAHLPAPLPSPAALLHRTQAALGLLRDVVQESSAEYWYEQARIKKDKRDYHGAIHDYNQAVILNPTFAAAYNNRGIIKFALKLYKEAICDYDYAISINPSHQTYTARAKAKEALNLYDEAFSDYTIAIKINLEFEPAYVSRGLLNTQLKHFIEAIADFSKAIELSPICINYLSRGIAKEHIGDHNGALDDYNNALEMKCDYHTEYNTLVWRAALKEKLGDTNGASKDRFTANTIARIIENANRD